MNGYLLDTNVVSMLAPSRSDATPAFLDWLERQDRDGRLFLSVVTPHEIERGVARLEAGGATAKAAALRAWLTGLLAAYERLGRALKRVEDLLAEAGNLKATLMSQSEGQTATTNALEAVDGYIAYTRKAMAEISAGASGHSMAKRGSFQRTPRSSCGA